MASEIIDWPMSCKAGLAVVIIYCVFTFTSWGMYPSAYSPLSNWLSDLGNSGSNPTGAIYFNAGCVFTGLALFPFFYGLRVWYTDEKRRRISLKATQIVGMLAAFSLMMIGVFSEDYGQLHTIWSLIFFVLSLVVLIMAGVSLFTHPNFDRNVGYYGFIVAGINVIFLALYTSPLFEWVTVFTALGYVALLVRNTLQMEL